MDDVRKTRVRKSKLVTVCSTDNEGFASLFPFFTYTGNSRSEKTSVEVQFPTYRENMMFYEHFDSLNEESPSRLSFMYVGGNDAGEVEYDFTKYKNVVNVDFSNSFATVNSIFQIVSQLPNCRELRVYLCNKNIVPTVDDTKTWNNVFDRITKNVCVPSYSCNSIKILKIMQVHDIDSNKCEEKETRFDYILNYAFWFLPKLQCLAVEGMFGNGRIYNLLDSFCKSKAGLPTHDYWVKVGKTMCQPSQPTTIASANHQVSHQIKNPPKISTTSTTSRYDPRIAATKRKFDNDLIPKKLDPIHVKTRKEADLEVIELPLSPKTSPIVINIDEDEESHVVAPKKVKTECSKMKIEMKVPPSPSLSADSKASVSDGTLPARIERKNSLTSLSSSYNNDWESSSDDEKSNDQVNSADPDEVSVSPVVAAVNNLSADYLRDVLKNANAKSPVMSNNDKQQRSSRSRMQQHKMGDYHYYRRAPQ